MRYATWLYLSFVKLVNIGLISAAISIAISIWVEVCTVL